MRKAQQNGTKRPALSTIYHNPKMFYGPPKWWNNIYFFTHLFPQLDRFSSAPKGNSFVLKSTIYNFFSNKDVVRVAHPLCINKL